MKNTRPLRVAILAMIAFSPMAYSQCVAGSFTNASSPNNNAAIGTIAWTNPTNILNLDATFTDASVLVTALTSVQTNWITHENFGFSIPATAVICGIEVEVSKSTNGVLVGGSVTDNQVQLIKGGVILGSNRAVATDWGSSFAYTTYGGPTDLWGTTWTPAEINAADFGMGLSANLNAGIASLLVGAQIDHIQIRIFADNSLPVELVNFQGTQVDQCSELSWKTASENNNDYFTIEKMIDGYFAPIAQVKSLSGTTTQESNYTFRDCETESMNYYRLWQTDLNGSKTLISKVELVAIDWMQKMNIQIFPNPSSDFVIIRSDEAIQEVTIYDVYGNKLITNTMENTSCKQHSLCTTGLISGVYYLGIQTSVGIQQQSIQLIASK